MSTLSDHKFIVFGVDHYNPLSVIRSLGKKGIQPIFIAMKGRWPIAEKSRYISELYHVDSLDQGYALLLEKFGNESEKPILFTCDDKAQEYLDQRYDDLKDRFYFFNAGEAGRIRKYMNKLTILELAKKHGLNVLDAVMVDRGVIPENLSYPIITKAESPTSGGWKSDVFICANADELKEAYTKIKSEKVLIQKFLHKKNECTFEGLSWNRGSKSMIAIECRYHYVLTGYYSPYMHVTSYANEEIGNQLKAMLEEIGFDGIWEAEFLVGEDDTLYFSEINFRNSPWNYSATAGGMHMPYIWANAMLNPELKAEDYFVDFGEGFDAMCEPIDYQKRVVEGNVPFSQWLYDFKRAKCGYYYDEEDNVPFMEMVDHWENLK